MAEPSLVVVVPHVAPGEDLVDLAPRIRRRLDDRSRVLGRPVRRLPGLCLDSVRGRLVPIVRVRRTEGEHGKRLDVGAGLTGVVGGDADVFFGGLALRGRPTLAVVAVVALTAKVRRARGGEDDGDLLGAAEPGQLPRPLRRLDRRPSHPADQDDHLGARHELERLRRDGERRRVDEDDVDAVAQGGDQPDRRSGDVAR